MSKKYISLEANIGRFSWGHRGDIGWFSPNGKLYVHGEEERLTPNVKNWSAKKALYAARIIVGFNVGRKPRWTMDDVVRIVRRVRKQQVGDPASTFVLQRGIYTHTETEDGERLTVDEKGAQIFLLNTPELGTSVTVFKKQMEDLAEILATDLRQEAVILEIQRGGRTLVTISMGPR
jgi:hypothetical protein